MQDMIDKQVKAISGEASKIAAHVLEQAKLKDKLQKIEKIKERDEEIRRNKKELNAEWFKVPPAEKEVEQMKEKVEITNAEKIEAEEDLEKIKTSMEEVTFFKIC